MAGDPVTPLSAEQHLEELREEWDALGLMSYHGIPPREYADLTVADVKSIRELLRRSKDVIDLLRRRVETEREAYEGMAVAARNLETRAVAAEARADRYAAALTKCPLCGHAWERHDPEDGECDAATTQGLGVCRCGRDIGFMAEENARLAREALAAGGQEPEPQEKP